MMKKIVTVVFTLWCGAVGFADSPSQLNLLLTQGSGKAMPIEIVPFLNDDTFAKIIRADLTLTGEFRIVDPSGSSKLPHQFSEVAKANTAPGVEAVIVGSVSNTAVNFSVADLVKGSNPELLVQQQYAVVPDNQKRALAHHISDVIYEKLTGVKGIFSTRIAYVQKSSSQFAPYSLIVSDVDGYNPRVVFSSKEPIMSPAWSADGKQLAFVSFENSQAVIYVLNLASAVLTKVSSEPGINGAPAWSPDGKKLALALSRGNGSPNIYLLDLATKKLTQITSDTSINTEPSFSPDGRNILFTSDRSSGPQIYSFDLAAGGVKRLTYSGRYNARASYSADGKKIVMINRQEAGYNISAQDLPTGVVTILTTSGRADSPSWSPNGKMVLYGTESGELGMVSLSGKMKLRIPAANGTHVQDPAWGPIPH